MAVSSNQIKMEAVPQTISLQQLPIELHLAGYDMILDHLSQNKASETYQLVCLEATAGEDVGVDEFASAQHVATHLEKSDCYGTFDKQTGKLCAMISISSSKFSRAEDPDLADCIIICDIKMKYRIFQPLLIVTQQLAADLAYEALLIEAFRTSSLLFEIQSEGFITVCCVPNSGKLMKKGWIDSFVLYKKLKQTNSLIPDCSPGADDPKLAFMTQKPRLTSLPKKYTSPSGKELVVRYIREDEIETVHKIYSEMSKKGRGYAPDEFVSLEIFRYCLVDNGHSFVLEDPETSKIVAAYTINPSCFCRSVNPKSTDGYIIVDQNYQNFRIGTAVMDLFIECTTELGYEASIGDTFVTNLPMTKITRNYGFVIIGYIPKAGNGKDNRPEDIIITYRDYVNRSKWIAKL